MYQIKIAGTSHVGKVRKANQDDFCIMGKNRGKDGEIITDEYSTIELPAFGIFDGMGGEEKGKEASAIASFAFDRYYNAHKGELLLFPNRFIFELCNAMNSEVCKATKELKVSTMGTTVALLAFGGRKIYFANVGDSRIYGFYNSQLYQISVDHVEKDIFNRKRGLIQYLGLPSSEFSIDPFVINESYLEGSKYLICTDGLSDLIGFEEIEKILNENIEIEKAVEVLLNRALDLGGKDNITIILCEVVSKNIVQRILGK